MASHDDFKITLRCQFCGTEVRVYVNYARQGKGQYCSRTCKAKGTALDTFRAQHGGRTPAELEQHLHSRKLTLAVYAAEAGLPLRTLYGHVERFGIKPYHPETKPKSEFGCQTCGRRFLAYDRPSRIGRNRYCSAGCRKAALRKAFDERSFRTSGFSLTAPAPTPGNYDDLPLGTRQRSFVDRGKLDHFFFRGGITDEERAYVFGVMLTDGNVGQGMKGSYYARLELTDHDIVLKIATALGYRGRLYHSPNRRTLRLVLASPYLYHDLVALGCTPRKTETARYPAIEPYLDRHLIRGIIDGDGSWVIRGRSQLSLQICGNDLLMQGVQQSIGHHLSVSPQAIQYPADHDVRFRMKSFAQMRYNTSASVAIRDWLYDGATIFGDRKRLEAYAPDSSYSDKTTTPRLARILGVAEDFIKRNVWKHQLPHNRIGPYFHFDEEHVAAWKEFLRARLRDPRCRLPNRAALVER